MWLYINIKRVLSAQSVILSQTCDKGAVLAVCLPNFQKITDISSNPEQKRLTHGIPKKKKTNGAQSNGIKTSLLLKNSLGQKL